VILHSFVKFHMHLYGHFNRLMGSVGVVCSTTYCVLKSCQSHIVKERLTLDGSRILAVSFQVSGSTYADRLIRGNIQYSI